MRDWQAYVRSHLTLPAHSPERQERIARELAVQLEDFYRDAIAGGLSEEEADGHARRKSPTGPASRAMSAARTGPIDNPGSSAWPMPSTMHPVPPKEYSRCLLI